MLQQTDKKKERTKNVVRQEEHCMTLYASLQCDMLRGWKVNETGTTKRKKIKCNAVRTPIIVAVCLSSQLDHIGRDIMKKFARARQALTKSILTLQKITPLLMLQCVITPNLTLYLEILSRIK